MLAHYQGGDRRFEPCSAYGFRVVGRYAHPSIATGCCHSAQRGPSTSRSPPERRGGKIDHPAGEHDDHANGAAGAMALTVRGIELAYGVIEPGPDTYHTRPGYGTLWDRRLAAPLWRRR